MEKIKGLKIGKSRNGKGVFTTKSFKNSDIILEINGKAIKCNVNDIIDEELRLNSYRYSKNDFICPKGKLAYFVNHSCKPNLKIVRKKGKLLMLAMKDLEIGEEVVLDYTTNSAVDDIWEMNCNCGEIKCRKIIGNITLLPNKLRKEYVRLNIIPKYILDIK